MGKTSIAKALAQKTGACHLRIDTIEQALIDTGLCTRDTIEGAGYTIAAEIAKENLRNGLTVIADCVNPLELTRRLWRDTAAAASRPALEVEFYCSDPLLHKERAKNRPCDIPRLKQPDWEDILNREYEPWTSAALRLNTARLSIEDSVQCILNRLADHQKEIAPDS